MRLAVKVKNIAWLRGGALVTTHTDSFRYLWQVNDLQPDTLLELNSKGNWTSLIPLTYRDSTLGDVTGNIELIGEGQGKSCNIFSVVFFSYMSKGGYDACQLWH